MAKKKVFEVKKFQPSRYADMSAYVVRFYKDEDGDTGVHVGISDDGKGAYFYLKNKKEDRKFLKSFVKVLQKASKLLNKEKIKKEGR